MKKAFALILTLSLCLGLCVPVLAEEDTVKPADSGTAYAAAQDVELDGEDREIQAYMLKNEAGNGTNYVKLRDIAALLDGSKAQFNVGWDDEEQLITVETGKAYTDRNGQEGKTPYTGDQSYKKNTSRLLVDGKEIELYSFTIYDEGGNGSNYFQLRNLGDALGFFVGWEPIIGKVVIGTDLQSGEFLPN